MGLPTHYYEKIIEKLGGNPAELPDRCECTMVDEIVHLIDSGIEGGGGGGGVFVAKSSSDEDGYTTIDKTYEQILEAVKTQPAIVIQSGYDLGMFFVYHYVFEGVINDVLVFAQNNYERNFSGQGAPAASETGAMIFCVYPDNTVNSYFVMNNE